MRYFWSLIVALMLVTLGLGVARRAGGSGNGVVPAPAVPAAGRSGGLSEQTPAVADAVPPVSSGAGVGGAGVGDADPAAEPAAEDAIAVPVVAEAAGGRELDADSTTEVGAAVEIADAGAVEAEAETGGGSGLSLDALLGVIEEAKAAQSGREETVAVSDEAIDQPAAAAVAASGAGAGTAEGSAVAPAGPSGPAFMVRADGSVEVEGAGVIAGDGSPERPFVIDWQVLRSVARDYNPKQGQEQLPAWVSELDGKTVRVEGNTLLPVVAPSVDELLVMQNPWDGCCVGIPPTPYDAIEVKLAKATRMGNTPTGFGMVEGTMKVDPYIVQGWLLGLYVIENASFESAAGMQLPGL